MSYLRDIFRQYLGENVVLFTVGMNDLENFYILYYKRLLDGNILRYLQCGTVKGAYATIDFI